MSCPFPTLCPSSSCAPTKRSGRVQASFLRSRPFSQVLSRRITEGQWSKQKGRLQARAVKIDVSSWQCTEDTVFRHRHLHELSTLMDSLLWTDVNKVFTRLHLATPVSAYMRVLLQSGKRPSTLIHSGDGALRASRPPFLSVPLFVG